MLSVAKPLIVHQSWPDSFSPRPLPSVVPLQLPPQAVGPDSQADGNDKDWFGCSLASFSTLSTKKAA